MDHPRSTLNRCAIGKVGALLFRDDVVDVGYRRVRSHFIVSGPTFLFQPGAGEPAVFVGVPQGAPEEFPIEGGWCATRPDRWVRKR